MIYQRRVKGHLRHYKSGKVGTVKTYTRGYSGRLGGFDLASIFGNETKKENRQRELLRKWFGADGDECFDFAERYGDDRFVIAAIRGFSSDAGFAYLQKNKNRLSKTIHAIDKYIDRNIDSTPRQMYHGANISDAQLRKALSGKPFSLTDGLFYATTSQRAAEDFAKGSANRCIFVISAHKGGYAHTERFSHYLAEQEVLFNSKTKVSVTGKPIRKDTINGFYYEIPCSIIYKD